MQDGALAHTAVETVKFPEVWITPLAGLNGCLILQNACWMYCHNNTSQSSHLLRVGLFYANNDKLTHLTSVHVWKFIQSWSWCSWIKDQMQLVHK